MDMPTRYSTFINENLRKQQIFYLAVGLSRQNICAEQSQKQYFLLVFTDIYFVLNIKIFVHMVP